MDNWIYNTAESYWESISDDWFGYTTPHEAGNKIRYSRMKAHRFQNLDYRSLFDLLPLEILEIIFIIVGDLLEDEEKAFYRKYFDKENTETLHIRNIRSRIPVPERGCIHTKINSPLGVISVQKIYGTNDASRCYSEISRIIENGIKSVSHLEDLNTMIINWGAWLCDHSYMPRWKRFLSTFIRKIYEFAGELKYIDFEKHKWIKNERDKDDAMIVIDNIRYFLEYYLPYIMFTRSKQYISSLEKYISMGFLKNTVDYLFQETRIHVNSINVPEVYEFEMETYAPEYYYKIYSKYMRLRNGKVIIPPGEKPNFYWIGDRYIQHYE